MEIERERDYLTEMANVAAKYSANQIVIYVSGTKFKVIGSLSLSSLAPMLLEHLLHKK